jgi:CHAT domain-containing protein/Tfp pilus assembly protein PilF
MTAAFATLLVAQDPQAPTILAPGKAVERELFGGQNHLYRLSMAAGEYAGVVVDQRGIDVVVQVLDPGGKVITEFDSESRRHGEELVSLIADSALNYELRIRAKYPKDPPGRYALWVAEVRKVTERERSLEAARRLQLESIRSRRAGKYDQALESAQRALDIRERLLGPEDQYVASALSNLGDVYRYKGEYSKAEQLQLRALEIRERMLEPEHPAIATSLSLLAEVYRLKGDYPRAESLDQRALQLLEGVQGPDHIDVGTTALNLALIYFDEGDYAQSEKLNLRALKIKESVLGPEDPDVAAPLHNLGLVYFNMGAYSKAGALYQRAMEIWEKTLGPDHPNVAFVLTNLGSLQRRLGNLDEAEQSHQRALKIWEKAMGPEHPRVADALSNLGQVYRARGEWEKGEQVYQRALAIAEKAFGPEHPAVATVLNNLANLYQDRGQLDRAEQSLQRALKITEKSRGPLHSVTASTISNLANIHRMKGDLTRAEELFQRALEIRQKTVGLEHPLLTETLSGLALIDQARGEYAKAEDLFHHALNISEKAWGPQHPEVSTELTYLSHLYAAQGDSVQAIVAQSRANAIIEHNLVINLATGSERQKLAYLASLSEITNYILSLHVRLAPDDPEARSLAATAVLQRKGRVLDAMTDSLLALRKRFGAQDQTLLDQLNDVTSQLATLVLNPPQRLSPFEQQTRVKALEEQRDQLEAEIGRRSAGYFAQSKAVTLAQVQAAIPRNAALIEFALFRPYNPKLADDKMAYGDSSYVAYVIREDGSARWAELGAAKEIDSRVDALRRALREPQRKDVRQLARQLDEALLRPARALVGDATRLLISPDGQLNLIPFEALVDEQGHYLVERYSISYLTSGRDLLRMQEVRDSKRGPVVLADPFFGEPRQAQIARADQPKMDLTSRRSNIIAQDFSSLYFAPLAGTAEEARNIESLFPEAIAFTGKQASKASLKQVVAPSILHIATHGFFLEDAPGGTTESATKSSETGRRAIHANVKVENPLLRSGLALAGANLNKGGDDDGILTALEASNLNLWGTKVVTLSACETGVGEVKIGEGVYGLRRAFFLAGAETLVMSLWPVSDRMTRDMMTAYYAGLKEGLGRGEALNQAQRAMLKRKDRQHPFYWASFIQSGEWKNLNGK